MPQIESFAPKSAATVEARQAGSVTPALSLLILVTVLMITFGLVMLYSASFGVQGSKQFVKQLMWVAIGFAGSLALVAIGYRRLMKISPVLLIGCFLALLVARFGFESVKGGYRWIRFGSISIQPSEFAKIALALFVAKYCAENSRTFALFRWSGGFLKLAAVVGAICLGIVLGKDLGTTVLVAAVAFVTMFAAGLYMRYLVLPLALAAGAAAYVVLFDPVRLARVQTFLHPENTLDGSGYQLWLSKIALGSGGWRGVGFLESRLKAKYLPEHHTDFILSILGEELGFVGILAVIGCYVVYGFAALKISLNARDKQGKLAGFALTLGVVFQAIINLAVVSGSAPTKGMSAPFFSYGGSNLLSVMFATAIIVSIALDTIFPDYNQNWFHRHE